MAVQAEPSYQYSFTCWCCVTDGSRGAVWQHDIWHEVHTKQMHGIKFLHAENVAPTNFHWLLLSIYGDQTMDVSRVRQWLAHLGSSDSRSHLLVQISATAACKFNDGWKCIANDGDYAEKQCCIADTSLYQTVLLCSLYLLQFPWEQMGGITFRVANIHSAQDN